METFFVRKSGRILKGILITLAALGIILSLWIRSMRTDKSGTMLDLKGTLAESNSLALETNDKGVVTEDIRLRSTSGLTFEMRVRRRNLPAGERLPVILLIGGHNTGKLAVDLVGPVSKVAFASIDYPYTGNHRPRGIWEQLACIPKVRRALLETPPALILSLEWLLQEPWVDPARIELVGISLGTPFAAIAGGLDERFCRVWLIHGAGDNRIWLKYSLKKYVPIDWMRGIVNEVLFTAFHGMTLRTDYWAATIPPRPLLIIAARDDESMPSEALDSLVQLAEREPKAEMFWTEGLHIGTKRPEVIQQLLERVLTHPR